MEPILSAEFHFNPQKNIRALTSRDALKIYQTSFFSALKFEESLPIFLDTNILLGYYGMPQKEKEKLLAFIGKYRDRICLTNEVEVEYLRNRLSVIERDLFKPYDEVIKEFKELKVTIENQLKSYRAKRGKILRHGDESLWTEFTTIEDTINQTIHNSAYFDMLQRTIKAIKEDFKNIELTDEILDIISEVKVAEKLDDDERKLLIGKFELYCKHYKEAKESKKERLVIPGCADEKNKDEAFGDFIIFNEMIKYLKINQTNCIFLTNDVTKGDWLRMDGKPHIHYLDRTYELTGHLIFIVNASRALENVSFINENEVTLQIIAANYGTDTVNQDVTSLLTQRIKNNKLTIRASNRIFGDPIAGEFKRLKIQYKLNNVTAEVIVPEHEYVSLG